MDMEDAACDILFTENEADFRATRDLDIVLIVEALTPEFAGLKLACYIGSNLTNKSRYIGRAILNKNSPKDRR